MNVEYVETINNPEVNDQNFICRNIFHGTFYKLGTPSIHNSLFRRNFEGKNYMYYCQLCDSLYDRRLYSTIGCGRDLRPNLNKKN